MSQDLHAIITTEAEGLLKALGVAGTVVVEVGDDGTLVVKLSSSDSALLIGYHGQTLQAFTVLLRSIVVRHSRVDAQTLPFFTVDCEDYLLKRRWTLHEMANNAVLEVRRTGKSVALPPMPNYERREVHGYVKEQFPDIFSDSSGEADRRHIILKPLPAQ
jgi:spoIIIJ-associated protein